LRPTSVFGPELNCAFRRFAAICSSVVIYVHLFRFDSGTAADKIRLLRGRDGFADCLYRVTGE
jgi:hypothetical protein